MSEVTTVDQLVDRLKKGKYRSSVDIMTRSECLFGRLYCLHIDRLRLVKQLSLQDEDIVAEHRKMSLKCPVRSLAFVSAAVFTDVLSS